MVDTDTVRRIALSLPEVESTDDPRRLAFSVRGKGFAWSWNERAQPKQPRAPRLDVLAIRCDPAEKELLVDRWAEALVHDDHYRGYPAILMRLEAIGEADLRGLLTSAWLQMAPKPLAEALRARLASGRA